MTISSVITNRLSVTMAGLIIIGHDGRNDDRLLNTNRLSVTMAGLIIIGHNGDNYRSQLYLSSDHQIQIN